MYSDETRSRCIDACRSKYEPSAKLHLESRDASGRRLFGILWIDIGRRQEVGDIDGLLEKELRLLKLGNHCQKNIFDAENTFNTDLDTRKHRNLWGKDPQAFPLSEI